MDSLPGWEDNEARWCWDQIIGHFPHLAFPVTRRRGDGASGRWGEWAKQIIGHFPFLIWHFPFRISDFFYFDDAGLPEIGSESKKMENEK